MAGRNNVRAPGHNVRAPGHNVRAPGYNMQWIETNNKVMRIILSQRCRPHMMDDTLNNVHSSTDVE